MFGEGLAFVAMMFSGIVLLGGISTVFSEGMNKSTTQEYILAAICLVVFVLSTAVFVSQRRKKRRMLELRRTAAEDRAAEILNIETLPVVESPASIILKPDEVCHYQCDARVRIVKNQVVGRTGGYRGASVRVAKGLTLHTGGSRGQSIRSNVPYDYPGIFSITSQRVIMTGEKGFEYPLGKLTAFTPYNGLNGINLQFGGKSYTLLMDEPLWVPKIIELIGEK